MGNKDLFGKERKSKPYISVIIFQKITSYKQFYLFLVVPLGLQSTKLPSPKTRLASCLPVAKLKPQLS